MEGVGLTEFRNAYAGQRVLVTGHTGFKGSWLCTWLLDLGAEVAGYALEPPTDPSMYDLIGIEHRLDHRLGDVRDLANLSETVSEVRPEVVFHLAAQPLVRPSYEAPTETIEVNVLGTANVLEAIRQTGQPCRVVVVTSDKAYENRGWPYGYRESDALGGSDPYSASKGAAELIARSYANSYFSGSDVLVATARAGNVIGGGDWAPDRLLPDFVAAQQENRVLAIRNPHHTRPWQHVLEPLSGYLWLGVLLGGENGEMFTGPWNFGPQIESVRSVAELADIITEAWGGAEWQETGELEAPCEAEVLALSWEKAFRELGWRPIWSLETAVEQAIEWYQSWAEGTTDLIGLTRSQVQAYTATARDIGANWSAPS